MTQTQPIITISDRTVGCDGGGGALGHPRVFLTVSVDTGQVDCPYCGRRFALDAAVSVAAGH